MKKILLLVFIAIFAIALIGCEKQVTEPINEQDYPFVDEDGKLNVDVSWHEFE